MDETGLFWKRMPLQTFILKEEVRAPGFEEHKDCYNYNVWKCYKLYDKVRAYFTSPKPQGLSKKNIEQSDGPKVSYYIPLIWIIL